MPGNRPRLSLALVSRAQNEHETTSSSVATEPWWWRAIVRFIILHGKWLLWPAHLLLTRMRNLNVHRALIGVGEQWKEAELMDRFVEVEKASRHDPHFHARCEAAMRMGRVRIFGLPVILDEEIASKGQGPIVRHLMWRQGDRSHPFPTK